MVKIFSLLFLFVGVVSCSTHRALYKSLDDDTFQGNAFLMTVDLEGKSNCSFTFLNEETQHKYLVQLAESKQDLLVEMPAGTYKISRLQCGFSFHEFKSFFGAETSLLKLKENKISYLGATKLNLKDSDLLKIEGDLKYRYEELKRIYSELGLFSRSNLISAYTSKEIGTDSFKDFQEKRSFNIKAVLVQSSRKDLDSGLEGVKKSTTECFFAEEKSNPLKFGVLNLRLLYQAKKFKSMSVIKNTSSYSEDLLNCLEEKWQALHMGATEKLSFDIHL
jgi:hypothetical protein